VSHHLGDRATAFVDGELDQGARDRALVHLADCADCRAAVSAERGAKAAVTSLGAPVPDADLLGRLLAVSGPSGPVPPRERPLPGTQRPPTAPRPGRPRTAARAGRRPPGRTSRRVGLVAAGAFSVVGLALGGAFVAGGQQPAPAGRPVVPAMAQLSSEHAASASEFVRLTDPGVAVVPASFGH
jgi:hypothetical protein